MSLLQNKERQRYPQRFLYTTCGAETTLSISVSFVVVVISPS